MKTKAELHAYLTAWANIDPGNKLTVAQITEIIARQHKRQGADGPADALMVTMAGFIEKAVPEEDAA